MNNSDPVTSSTPADLLDAASAVRISGATERALDMYRHLVASHPDYAMGWQHLGALLRELGHPAEAEGPLRRALALAPKDIPTRHSLGTTLMALGRYLEGWSFYSVRFEMTGHYKEERPKNFPFPQWRSWHVGGKHILIFPEQGHGDQIQMARFVPVLMACGAQVTLLTRPALLRLFEDSFPGARVMVASGPVHFPDPDFWVMSSDLPGLAEATVETLPAHPYLRTSASWPALPPGFKVGLVTKGNPIHARDAHRSLPPASAERLRAGLPGIVIGLLPDESNAGDFADTAAIIAQLDLVVTVDTSVAHLAGGLGKKCFVLVPGFGTDWRWMTGRDDSPWYPSLTLYRGAADGDWTAAIDRLVTDVRALAARTAG